VVARIPLLALEQLRLRVHRDNTRWDGSRSVTIEAVTQAPGPPLIAAGPVLYIVPTLHNELCG
jgi:hypothetical protein